MTIEFDPKNMIFRRLGGSGLQVPIISLGGWLTYGTSVKGDPVKDIIKSAFDAGINYFDTAESYANGESELEMGRAIRELGIRRSDLVISTKVFGGVGRKGPNNQGLSRKHVIEGVFQSLERLDMEYVDIVFAHQPDPNVPMLEIVRVFSWLIDQGKAFYWGTSGWSALEIEEAHHAADSHNLHPPVAEQCRYNALQRGRVEKDLKHTFDRYGYGTTVYSPLAASLLTGKYNDGIPDSSRYAKNVNDPYIRALREELNSDKGRAQISKVRALGKIAKELGDHITTAQLALAWVARNPRVSTLIIGASSPAQIEENLKALDVLPKVTDSVYARINDIFADQM